MSQEQQTNLRIDHSMPLTSVIAVGSLVTVGLGIYLLIGPVYSILGQQTPTQYVLTIFFSIPLVLALAERSSGTPGRGGLFNLSRSSGSVPLAFATGWLVVIGLVALAALFAWESGLAVSRILSLLFEIELDGRLLSVFLLLLVLLRVLSSDSDIWKRRKVFVFAALLLLFFMVVAAWLAPVEIPTTWVYMPEYSALIVFPYLAVGLWSLHFVLDRRDELQRPRRRMLSALWLPVIIGGVSGMVAAATLLLYPTITYGFDLPLISLALRLSPLLALLFLLAMFLFGLVGMNESFTSLTRLSQSLCGDGFLPRQLRLFGHELQLPIYTRLFTIIIVPIVLLFIPLELQVTQAVIAIVLAMVLVNVQDLFRSKPRMAQNRWPKLPLHPLFPGLAAALGLTLILLLDIDHLLAVVPWIAAGVVLYIVYSRQGAITVRHQDVLITGAVLPAKKKTYRVLVAISEPAHAASMIRLGAQIAAAHDGLLLILYVCSKSGDQDVDQILAENSWQELNSLIPPQDGLPVEPVPLVRLAATPSSGILTTIWEEKIDITLLGWPAEHVEDEGTSDGTIESIVDKVQCEVAILRGEWHSAVEHILVPVVSASHSVAALSLGQDLAKPAEEGGQVVALRVVPGKLSDEKKSQAEHMLRKTRGKLVDPSGIEGEVIGSHNTKEGILQQAGGYDLLLLGLSDEGFLAKTDFSGLPVEVASNVETPTILVKCKEKTVQYWLRRSWDRLYEVLPTLSRKRRRVVGKEMRDDAKADIDFYFLMVMAASIALFGLLQNSAAVIIGAMLVAPLMSPILAMAHSIVRGQLTMLREAADSAFKGIVLAITVAALLSLGLLVLGIPIPPTDEILARTQPNFLDLLVALASGAAAAYAISRSEVSAALPGVAIAAALVPPLAVVGYGLGTAQFDYAAGSLLLFLTNLAAIILAAAVIFLLLGFRPPLRDDRDEQARFGLKMAIVALILIAIPLFATTRVSANQAARNETIYRTLDQYWAPSQAQVADVVVTDERNEDLLVSCAIFDYAGVVDDQALAELQVELSDALDEPVKLSASIVDAQLSNYDDASAARLLTTTPTPLATPELSSILPAVQTPLPQHVDELPIGSVETRAGTAEHSQGEIESIDPEIDDTPLADLTKTAFPALSVTNQPGVTPTITPLPLLTVVPE